MEDSERKAQVGVRKRRIRVGRYVFGAIGVGLVGLFVVAMLPKPALVEVVKVTEGELVVTIDEDGVTRVTDRYVVSAPLSGHLARIQLEPGDVVKQGDVVARILPARAPLLDVRSLGEAEARVSAARAQIQQAGAQIERARAASEHAEREAEKTTRLHTSGTLTQNDLDRALLERRSRRAELVSAEFAAKVATHELRMAEATLGRHDRSGEGPRAGDVKDAHGQQFEVTSPISGQVLGVLRQSEGIVPAGEPLVEVGDPAALEIAVDLLTSDAVEVIPGAPVTVDEWGGARLSGAVARIEPSAFSRLSALGVEEQRVNAVIDLTSPYEEWKRLGDGYRVEARIEVYRTERAVRVPWSALFRQGGRWSLFVVEGEKARLRAVETTRRNDLHAEVTQGVRPGDTVIVHPSEKIQDGVAVTTEP